MLFSQGITEKTHADYIKNLAKDVETDLTEKIGQALVSLPTLDSCTAEVVSHVAFCQKRSLEFIGRTDLVEKATKYYDPAPNQLVGKNLLAIHGTAGAGKSCLIAKLVSIAREKLSEEHVVPIVVVRFCGATQASSSARDLISNMCEQLRRALNLDTEIPTNFGSLKHTFEQILRKADYSHPLLVFIDGLDQLSDEDNGRSDLGWLPASLPPNVYFAVSTLPDTGGCLEALKSKELPAENYLEVEAVTKDDAGVILKAWLDDANRKLTLAQFNHVISMALDASKETPNVLRLRLLFDLAVRWSSYDQLPTLPSSIQGIINELFNALERSHGKALMSTICGLLGASMHGLPEDDLIDIISTSDSVLDSALRVPKPPIQRLPPYTFLRVKWDLGRYLVHRGNYGRSVLCWYHKQFQAVAARKYVTGATNEGVDKKAAFSKLIAEYYSEISHKKFPKRGLTTQPLYWVRNDGQITFNLTKLSELPNSISQCLPDDVKILNDKCLCNLSFLAAKCAAGLSKELVSDLQKAMKLLKDERLSAYNIFLVKNVHILDRDPHLAVQQMMNMPDNLDVLHKDIKGMKPRDVTPWISNEQICHTANLVNKPTGIHPCNITIQASDSLPGRTFSDIQMIDVGHRCYFVVCSTMWGWADKIDIYDRFSGKLALRIEGHKVTKTGSTVCEVRVHKDKDSAFNIICRNYDDVYLKIITVSVGETLMDFKGPVIDGDWASAEKDPLDCVNFEMTHDMKRIVTYVLKKDSNTPDDFKTLLAVWDVGQCLQKKQGEVCNKPLVKKVGSENFLANKGTGYGISAIAFSPNDKYIICALSRPQETGNPICMVEAATLNPVWMWRGYGRFQCSCMFTYPSSVPNTWNVILAGASYRGNKYGLALHTNSSGQMVSKNLWKGIGVEVKSIAVFPSNEPTTMVFRLDKKLLLTDIPKVSLSDYKKWTAPGDEENTEYSAELGEGIEFTDFDTMLLSMCTGENSDCSTISKTGEVKLLDLSLCSEYKAPDKLPSAISASCLSPDKNTVYTSSPHGVCSWDSRTGKLLSQYKISGMFKVAKTDSDQPLAGTYKGSSVVIAPKKGDRIYSVCDDNFIAFLQTSDVKGADNSWHDAEEMNYLGLYEVETPAGGLEKIEVSRHSVTGSQLSLSPDGLWMCVALRYMKKLNVCLIDTRTKKCVHKLVHDHPQITDGLFESLYHGTFSNDGQYLAVWGTMHIVYNKVRSNHGCTAEIWPPLIKLFEFNAKQGELNAVSQTQSEGHRPAQRPSNVYGDDTDQSDEAYQTADLSGLIFLPGDKYIITSTRKGFLELRKVPKIEVVYKLLVHEDAITTVKAVQYKEDILIITGSPDKWVYIHKLIRERSDMRKRTNSNTAALRPGRDTSGPNNPASAQKNGPVDPKKKTPATDNKKKGNVKFQPQPEAPPASKPNQNRRPGSGVTLDPITAKSTQISLQQVTKYYNGREVTTVSGFIDKRGNTNVLVVQVCDAAGRVNVVNVSVD